MSDHDGNLEGEPDVDRPPSQARQAPEFTEIEQIDLARVLGTTPEQDEADDEVDEDRLLRMTYELRLQVTDKAVGIIEPDVWEAMVEDVLDRYWPES